MQIDFHHAVTYAMSRLAGFNHEESRIIAYAAQYVDDCTNRGTVQFDNDTKYSRIASAHVTRDLLNHCDIKEDCRVWVPFHFLPGNNGAPAGEAQHLLMPKRLVCTPDSHTATDMWKLCTEAKVKDNALHRLGITCHVYEDTFAHCDFAGIPNRINIVSEIAHGVEKFKELIDNVVSTIIAVVPLGHGTVKTFPDWPFLEWRFTNSEGSQRTRNNPENYLKASKQLFLHLLFYRGEAARKLPAEDSETLLRAFKEFTEVSGDQRHMSWMKLIREGGFSFGGLSQAQADSLLYAPRGPRSWKYEALGPDADREDGKIIFHYTPEFKKSNWLLFHEALKEHQADVLDKILPKYGIKLPV